MPLPLEKNVRLATGRAGPSANQPLPTCLDFICISGRDVLIHLVDLHVHHHVGRRPAGGFGEHIGHALQILVVDHLIDAGRLPSSKLGQRNQLAAVALDLDLRQIGRTGPLGFGHAQLDPQADCVRCRCGSGPPSLAFQHGLQACRRSVRW